MNNKRQTIWLVSMLSLMVILSAYYLFTEDVGTPSNDIVTTDGTQKQSEASNATEASGTADDNAIVANEVTGGDAGQTETADKGKAAAEDSATKDAADSGADVSDGTATAKTDDEVLKEIEAAGGVAASVFSQMQEQRDQSYYDEYNKLMNKVSDSKVSEKDAATYMDQVNLLEDKNTKITGLEEELSKQFGNAAVVPDAGDHYKIVVQSDKLERTDRKSVV